MFDLPPNVKPKLKKGRMAALKALIFDFDGTIIDTETSDFNAWKDTCDEFSCDFPETQLRNSVGSSSQFDALSYVVTHSPMRSSALDIQSHWQERYDKYIATTKEARGLRSLLKSALKSHLRLAIASSSSRNWIVGHLKRLNLMNYFDVISSGDEVLRVKPYPDVYMQCLASLDCHPNQAIAFEDSMNGVLASRDAGIYTIWIPNEVTRKQGIQTADQTIKSFLTVDMFSLMRDHSSRENLQLGNQPDMGSPSS